MDGHRRPRSPGGRRLLGLEGVGAAADPEHDVAVVGSDQLHPGDLAEGPVALGHVRGARRGEADRGGGVGGNGEAERRAG